MQETESTLDIYIYINLDSTFSMCTAGQSFDFNLRQTFALHTVNFCVFVLTSQDIVISQIFRTKNKNSIFRIKY